MLILFSNCIPNLLQNRGQNCIKLEQNVRLCFTENWSAKSCFSCSNNLPSELQNFLSPYFFASLTAAEPLGVEDLTNIQLAEAWITQDKSSANFKARKLAKKIITACWLKTKVMLSAWNQAGNCNWNGSVLRWQSRAQRLFVLSIRSLRKNCFYPLTVFGKSHLNRDLHFENSGYDHMRHKEISDTFGEIMHDNCYDVEIDHQGSIWHQSKGLLDIQIQQNFLDVKLFNP